MSLFSLNDSEDSHLLRSELNEFERNSSGRLQVHYLTKQVHRPLSPSPSPSPSPPPILR